MIADYRQAFVSDEYQAEMVAIAEIIERSPDEVLVANLYSDAMRALLGCSAPPVSARGWPCASSCTGAVDDTQHSVVQFAALQAL